MLLGYHASHEQFSPAELLGYVREAEAAGFTAAKSSDHFHPWSERQGQSGFAWAWLGSAMQATRLPFGTITVPGYRYHPAIVAQAAATLAQMYPERLWVALGSGEAINEAITGLAWPEKAERNARLRECVDIIRALWTGEKVTHRGRVVVVEAKLYSRPSSPIPLFGAAITPDTARFCGSWADGLLTTGGDVEAVRRVIDAFRETGGADKPVHIQHALSWAENEEQALAQALDQWAPVSVGGEVNWLLRQPAQFDLAAKGVSADQVRKSVFVSADLGRHRAHIEALADLGAAGVHLHCVGRNQSAFIEAFGRSVVPQFSSLRSPDDGRPGAE